MTDAELPLLFDDERYKVALAYSGGKDSSVLLDLCRPWKDRFTVVWINTGYAFPHIKQHVTETTQDFNFQEISHDLAPIWERYGTPTHILPTDHAPLVTAKAKPPFLQNWMACCLRRMESVVEALAPQGYNVLLTGQRSPDGATMLRQSFQAGGMNVVAPLWEWSDEQVKAHIAEHDVKLPMSASFDDTSMECWHCPGQIEKRAEFIRAHYPEFLPVVRKNVGLVREVIQARLDEMAI